MKWFWLMLVLIIVLVVVVGFAFPVWYTLGGSGGDGSTSNILLAPVYVTGKAYSITNLLSTANINLLGVDTKDILQAGIDTYINSGQLDDALAPYGFSLEFESAGMTNNAGCTLYGSSGDALYDLYQKRNTAMPVLLSFDIDSSNSVVTAPYDSLLSTDGAGVEFEQVLNEGLQTGSTSQKEAYGKSAGLLVARTSWSLYVPRVNITTDGSRGLPSVSTSATCLTINFDGYTIYEVYCTNKGDGKVKMRYVSMAQGNQAGLTFSCDQPGGIPNVNVANSGMFSQDCIDACVACGEDLYATLSTAPCSSSSNCSSCASLCVDASSNPSTYLGMSPHLSLMPFSACLGDWGDTVNGAVGCVPEISLSCNSTNCEEFTDILSRATELFGSAVGRNILTAVNILIGSQAFTYVSPIADSIICAAVDPGSDLTWGCTDSSATNYDASATSMNNCTYSLWSGTCTETDGAPAAYPCNLTEAMLGDGDVNGILYWAILKNMTVCDTLLFTALGDGILVLTSSIDTSCLASTSTSFSDAETETIIVALSSVGCITPPCVATYEGGKLTAILSSVDLSGNAEVNIPQIYYERPSSTNTSDLNFYIPPFDVISGLKLVFNFEFDLKYRSVCVTGGENRTKKYSATIAVNDIGVALDGSGIPFTVSCSDGGYTFSYDTDLKSSWDISVTMGDVSVDVDFCSEPLDDIISLLADTMTDLVKDMVTKGIDGSAKSSLDSILKNLNGSTMQIPGMTSILCCSSDQPLCNPFS